MTQKNTITKKISLLSRVLLFDAAPLLIVSIFVPIWRIDLDAPQYPEGLRLLIYSYNIGGDVEIINGLNHYIGMQTLHTENFIEFAILPYIIGLFALYAIIVAITRSRKHMYLLLTAFILFGIIAMIDFWRWEYNYGHNLNPNAAIIVPGMAYQPPLIGFKQLLNFGAYSIPDLGGWLFILSGMLMLSAVFFESSFYKKFVKNKYIAPVAMFSVLLFSLNSCSTDKPEPIAINKDQCDFCKMTITDGRFGCELITAKGRIYKFDDLNCMLRYKEEKRNTQFKSFFVHDYSGDNLLIPAENADYIESEHLKSPMGGNIAAFSDKNEAETLAKEYGATLNTWGKINQNRH